MAIAKSTDATEEEKSRDMDGPTVLIVMLALLIALVAVGGLAGTRVLAELGALIEASRGRSGKRELAQKEDSAPQAEG
jgi:hypothetical protein